MIKDVSSDAIDDLLNMLSLHEEDARAYEHGAGVSEGDASSLGYGVLAWMAEHMLGDAEDA